MADHLLVSEWKKAAGSKPPAEASVLGKRLEAYGKIRGKAEPEDEASALDEIADLAASVKKKIKNPPLGAYLDKLAKQARDEKHKIETEAAEEEAEAAKSGKDLVLAKMLKRALTRDSERPLLFTLAIGRPFCGLVIDKVASSAQKARAREARTLSNGRRKDGKIFMGRCYGEGGKVVFELGLTPDESFKPPSGLAKGLKATVNKQTAGASKSVRLRLRGGGVDLDDEADDAELADLGGEEPEPEPTAAPEPEPSGAEDPAAGRFAERLRGVEARFEQAARDRRGDVSKMRAALGLASERAATGHYDGAFAALAAVERLLDAAGAAAHAEDPAEAAARLLERQKSVIRQSASVSHEVAVEIKQAILESQEHGKAHAYDAAHAALDRAEALIHGAASDAGAPLWARRLAAINDDLKAALALGNDDARAIKLRFSEALALSKEHDYGRAIPLLNDVAGLVHDALARAPERAGAGAEAATGAGAEPTAPADFPEADERAFLSRWERARDGWRTAIEAVDAQISQLQAAMKSSGFPELSSIADAGLNGATGNHKVPVLAAVRDIDSSAGPARLRAILKARPAVEAFRRHIDTDELVAVCDDNPFEVPVTIRRTLGPALDGLSAALQSATTS
jgi:hypothetical protein